LTRRVHIATPTYSGQLSVEYVGSLMANLADLTVREIVPDIAFKPGLCYVALARNEMVGDFLASDADDLVFIDDDVGFPADAVWKLLRHDVDIVGGVYPYKRDDGQFPIRYLPEGAPVINGLMLVEGLPTGFLRIRRRVFERMIEAMPERKFTDPISKICNHDLFACERVDGVWWGEDYRFCQLARSLGFKIWVEPDIDFRHVGRNVWRGNLLQSLTKDQAA
jgi:hypothetical protein